MLTPFFIYGVENPFGYGIFNMYDDSTENHPGGRSQANKLTPKV